MFWNNLEVTANMVISAPTSTSITDTYDMSTPMADLIDKHDRPYSEYGHLSMSPVFRRLKHILITICDLGHETIARKCRFDLLGTKTAGKRRLNKDRMSRKMYAITCRTDIAGKKELYFL
jgi:hypothetical protein